MATAVLRQGKNASMADHTPSVAIDAGDVVVIGNYPKVCHRPIPANEKGALSEYGGVYRMVAGGAIGNSVDVYLNVASGKVNASATATAGDKHYGRSTNGMTAAADLDELDILHMPNGTSKT
jgi:predicted RecA/RadA family phage recombinase